MGHSTLLPTHKVPIDNFNALASKLRQAGAKFRSSIHKQDATIVFSQLPSQALSILESGANFQETCEADLSSSTLTQVTESMEVTGEISMDELGVITLRESVGIVESSEPNSMDNLIEATAPEIVESVEDVPEFVESVENTVAFVESTTLATEQQLLELSKTKLKKLANKYGIEGRTRLEHHELVAALVNKVSLENL